MDQRRLGQPLFSNGRARNGFTSQQSAIKLAEKYKDLAKEALSSGDKILSENYFQHADHFTRIIDEKNLSSNQNKIQTNTTTSSSEKTQAENIETNQSQVIKEEK